MKSRKSKQQQRADRASVLWSGHLLYGDQVIDCLIVNISVRGALVRTENASVWQSSVILRNPRIGDLVAEVIGRENNELRLRFLGDDEKVAAIIGKAL